MRTKVTLVLLFLNVALFFFIFKFERQWRTEAQLLESRRRVLGTEAVNLGTIEVASSAAGGTNTIALIKRRETWFLTQPLEWPANPAAVQGIINDLQLLEHETSFAVKDLAKSGLSLAEYGLDKPKLTVSFSSADPASPNTQLAKTSLAIGDTTKDGNRVYILSPDGQRIHVVDRSRVAGLFLPLEQLRSDTVLTIPVFEAQSLSIQGTIQGSIRVSIRRENSRWTFNTPITARASKLVTESTISQLNALHAKSFLTSPPTSPSSAPTLRIALEGNNRHETLFLGEPVASAASAPAKAPPNNASPENPAAAGGSAPAKAAPAEAPKGDVEYYAQLDGRPAVFTVVVPADLIIKLNNATDKLREKHILDFDAQAVTAITIATQVQSTPPVTLQWLDPATAGTGSATWQIVRRDEVGPGLQTPPADRTAVQRLLSDLLQLEAQSFSDNPAKSDLENWGFNRPEREITLTIANQSAPPPIPTTSSKGDSGAKSGPAPAVAGTTVVLQLGTDPSGKVYARAGNAVDPGLTIYAVEVDIAGQFPIEPSAWRDRTLPVISGNARVTALKFVDVVSGESLLETTFDPAGHPAAGVRNPEVVQALIQHLRTLRAKRFRPGGWVERVIVDAEERPWRYRLEVTIALPGGAGDQTGTKTLFLTERLGGSVQLAGSKELDAVFEVEQPFLDELGKLIYGPRDPGPPPAEKG